MRLYKMNDVRIKTFCLNVLKIHHIPDVKPCKIFRNQIRTCEIVELFVILDFHIEIYDSL